MNGSPHPSPASAAPAHCCVVDADVTPHKNGVTIHKDSGKNPFLDCDYSVDILSMALEPAIEDIGQPAMSNATTHRRLHQLVHALPKTRGARWLQGSIQFLILLNVAAVVLETVDPLGSTYRSEFHWFEWFSVGMFTLEYVVRLMACTGDERFRAPITGRLRYAATPLALIDLVAILPAFLPWIGVDLRSFRALRLMRVFRILKMGRYSRAIRSLGRAVTSKREELIITVFAMSVLLVLAASVLFFAENEAQPDVFSSIPAAAWWAVATLTTVGYGDMAPVTAIGKLAASLVAILGLALFALPAGVLASAFVEQFKQPGRCPHCGKDLS
jgi:voltage-gated potassium channel